MTCGSDLFKLQAVAPRSLQQVAQTVDECVLLQPRDVGLPLTQFHTFLPHPLHQHLFRLFAHPKQKKKTGATLSHLCSASEQQHGLERSPSDGTRSEARGQTPCESDWWRRATGRAVSTGGGSSSQTQTSTRERRKIDPAFVCSFLPTWCFVL